MKIFPVLVLIIACVLMAHTIIDIMKGGIKPEKHKKKLKTVAYDKKGNPIMVELM